MVVSAALRCAPLFHEHNGRRRFCSKMSISAEDLPDLRPLQVFQKNLASRKITETQVLGLHMNSKTHDIVRELSACTPFLAEFSRTKQVDAYMQNLLCLGMATCRDDAQAWIHCLRASSQAQGSGAKAGVDVSRCEAVKRRLAALRHSQHPIRYGGL